MVYPINPKYLLLIGPDELSKGMVKIKDMQTGEERLVDQGNIIHALSK